MELRGIKLFKIILLSINISRTLTPTLSKSVLTEKVFRRAKVLLASLLSEENNQMNQHESLGAIELILMVNNNVKRIEDYFMFDKS